MMKRKTLKEALTQCLGKYSLGDLRVYARSLGSKRPTALPKERLITEIIQLLCHEMAPNRNKRGAPIKSDSLNENLVMEIEELQKIYSQSPENEQKEEITTPFIETISEKENTPKEEAQLPLVSEESNINVAQPYLLLPLNLKSEKQRRLLKTLLDML